MAITRREFIQSAVAACGFSGCSPNTEQSRILVLGSPEKFVEGDNVLTLERVLVVRRGNEFRALSILCTHQPCVVEKVADGEFFCPCHGSRFDADGKVTLGPASKDLPWFKISLNSDGKLVADLNESVNADFAFRLDGVKN